MAFKVAQLAKDLGIKSKEITELMTAKGLECKTTSKSLDVKEFDIVFDALTRKKQVVDIDGYLFGDTYIPSVAAVAEAPKKKAEAEEAPKAAAAPAVPQKPVETKQVAAEKPAAKEKAAPEVKSAPKTESAPAPTSKEPVAEKKPEKIEKTEKAEKIEKVEKPAVKVEEKPAEPQRPAAPRTYNIPQNLRATINVTRQAPQAQQPRRDAAPAQAKPAAPAGRPMGERPAGDRFARPDFQPRGGVSAPAKPQFGNQNGGGAFARDDKRAQKPQQNRGGAAPGGFRDKDEGGGRIIREQFRPTVITRGQTPKGTEATKQARTTRVVDMRGSSVDLSKYDDRLDTFVPDAVRDARGGSQRVKKNVGTHAFTAGKKGAAAKKSSAPATKQALHVTLPEEITVSEFASRMKIAPAEVVKKLMLMGMMVTLNQTIDFDTAFLIASELGVEATKEVVVSIEEKLFDDTEDAADDLMDRAPVVCVMGHVDHGKTSLLDAIRHTNVTAGEAGGITQHIGAYRVKVDGRDLTFLDTPGHEAFTAMRARGAKATDIAILVVAADDGIMPQTVEAINHAKAAEIDIIVAINKMDKPGANPDAIKQELTKYDLVPEEWGGDVICVPISALKREGIDTLLENVLLVADMKELKANPDRRAKGIIIESKLDRGRGPVATVLVQNGTLHSGDIVIAGTAVGRVRVMSDHNGRLLKEAGPSVPVEIVGLAEVPEAGDEFAAVEDERMARTLADQRRDKAKEEGFKANARANLNDLFAQISEGVKELNIIVKADVAGSAEAVKQSLEKLTNEEVKVRVIHAAVGGIIEGDVMLAAASNAIIVGFNVRPDKAAIDSAERQKVDIRTYRIIYECIEEIEAAMKGMLAPKFRENVIGHAEVRQTIHVPNVGFIAGSYVQDGKITRQAQIRVVRDGIVIFEDKIASLRRFKDDVKEVADGYECGIALDRFNDIKVGDVLEAFVMEEIAQ